MPINFLKKIVALAFLIIFSPVILVMYIAVRLTSRGSFIFKQRRAGKDEKIFWLYKIRTMVSGAEKQRAKLLPLNEADGPVFKIRNDPRYTKVGKFLSHSGLDELPQLLNILKGEMNFVGPRPLPVFEAAKIPKKYHLRFRILPGMTSPWIIGGAHKMLFKEWMELDVKYVKTKSLAGDLKIFIKTAFVIMELIKNKIVNYDR